MLSKRILVLVFVVASVTLLIGCVGCLPTTPNATPYFTSVPSDNATVGKTYIYDVDAIDPDSDTLTYSLGVHPAGMNINSVSGLIQWTPVDTQVGNNLVSVKVSDGVEIATQGFTITVSDRTAMTMTVTSPLIFTVNESRCFTVDIVANDDEGKSVTASFECGGIDGTLEIIENKGLASTKTNPSFQTGIFTLENATLNFKGTFTSLGTYPATIEVKTYPGDVLLCSKAMDITVNPTLSGELAAEDFGWVDRDTGGCGQQTGYATGFGLTDATFEGIKSMVVKLYVGDTLLQTNTATPKVGIVVTGVQISSPFDVFGTFNYAVDGYWINEREAEYGQGIDATKVIATVILANDKTLTAENTNPTNMP